MTGWYTITPSGPITLGNLTPVGQNSGQVGCRWPPNGHQLAACLFANSPKITQFKRQLLGPFWCYQEEVYFTLPQTIYYEPSKQNSDKNKPPTSLFRMQLQENQLREKQWSVQSKHEQKDVEMLGGQFLIDREGLQDLCKKKYWSRNGEQLQELPWETLTLSHNRRGDDFQVLEENGFFAEMTTLLKPGWSILVKIIGEDYNYRTEANSFLGAGATPITIQPIDLDLDWLEADCPDATGAVLLTAALWQKNNKHKVSVPYPPCSLKAYAAENGIPWQTWKKVKDRNDPKKTVPVLTPGEWMTPAGAIYLWEGFPPISKSGPFPNPDDYKRDVLGYGHLWLFKEEN
ncbi:type III-B CRISPR module-associated Cmr3 family protein [Planktothrix agardhii]|jgi:hypothetical protein|uniref:type III-B CRISPR module-associated Cmr3 family protein n=1 Tax=Planktothrix agardhii TaxID=1160 RepID=UPI001D0BA6D7|nr:type III-B CRISPR module-associated Cmr3 family protein [Planktothrix agardhii]MCB8788991.1 hypothetical protein [Planktothrix agardhii 1025]MCF3614284.1 hypothetical protein [Planktothrix agardhii 1027]